MMETDNLSNKHEVEERDAEGMAPRKLTDPICLLIFLAYLGGMIYCVVYGFTHGDIRKLTHGMDFDGRVCGVHQNMSHKRYLYWCGKQGGATWNDVPLTLNLDMPICVETCPSAAEDMTYCPNAGEPKREIQGNPNAEYSIITTIKFDVTAQPSYPTKPMGLKFCWPKIEGNDTMQELMTEQLKSGPMAGATQKVIAAAGDVENAKYLLYSVIALGFVLSLLYLVALKWLARPLVYTALVILILAPLIGAVACLLTTYNVTGNQAYSPFFKALPHDQAMLWSQVTAAVFILISIGFLVLTICARKTIDMCVGCIATACDCIFDMPTMLLEPIIGGLLKIFIFFGLLWGLIWLVSTGTVGADSMEHGGKKIVGLSRTVDVIEEQRSYIIYYMFGILWIMAMCDGMQNFVIGYAVVIWYYQPKDPNGKKSRPFLPCLRGFGHGLLFHLGSIAFGSFLIAATDALRLIMSVIAKQATASGNTVGACVAKCCTCCLTCFRKFLEYINKNAYIDIAIRSSNFIPAAVHTFEFIASEAAGIAILNGACTVAQVGGVLSITSLGGYLAFLCIDEIPQFADPYSDYYVQQPLIIVGVAAFICFNISLLFMLVFDMASDTLLYTFADQRKRSPSDVDKFAPKILADLVDNKM